MTTRLDTRFTRFTIALAMLWTIVATSVAPVMAQRSACSPTSAQSCDKAGGNQTCGGLLQRELR